MRRITPEKELVATVNMSLFLQYLEYVDDNVPVGVDYDFFYDTDITAQVDHILADLLNVRAEQKGFTVSAYLKILSSTVDKIIERRNDDAYEVFKDESDQISEHLTVGININVYDVKLTEETEIDMYGTFTMVEKERHYEIAFLGERYDSDWFDELLAYVIFQRSLSYDISVDDYFIKLMSYLLKRQLKEANVSLTCN